MYMNFDWKSIANNPKTNNTEENMKRLPPIIVKSVFVVNAYNVRDTVTASVRTAANKTNYPPFPGYKT